MIRFTSLALLFLVGRVFAQAPSVCPGSDTEGGSLTGGAPLDSDGFFTCTYSKAGACSYFKDGSFSSGSSGCPHNTGADLSGSSSAPPPSSPPPPPPLPPPPPPPPPPQTNSGGSTNSGNNNGGSSSSSQAPSVCPSKDTNGGSLTGGAPLDSDGFFTCTYSQAGTCSYFKDGSFSSGSSTCPHNTAADLDSSSSTPLKTTSTTSPPTSKTSTSGSKTSTTTSSSATSTTGSSTNVASLSVTAGPSSPAVVVLGTGADAAAQSVTAAPSPPADAVLASDLAASTSATPSTFITLQSSGPSSSSSSAPTATPTSGESRNLVQGQTWLVIALGVALSALL